MTEPQYRVKPAAVSDVRIFLIFLPYHGNVHLVISFLVSVCLLWDLSEWLLVFGDRLCGQRPWANLKAWIQLKESACGLSLCKVSKIFLSALRLISSPAEILYYRVLRQILFFFLRSISSDMQRNHSFSTLDIWILTLFFVGFLQLQDEVLVSDRDRIKTTQSNVKMVSYHFTTLVLSHKFSGWSNKKLFDFVLQLQRHLQAHTFPSIERLRQKEQSLQRRMLRVRKVVALKDLTLLCESRLQSKLHLPLCSGLCASRWWG